MPTIKSDTAWRTRNEIPNTKSNTRTPPKMAEITNPQPLCIKAMGRKELPNRKMATPKLAPELTPNT